MHRRLWLNDPDCLMARDTHTRLTPTETTTLARTIAATGGMTMLSDDIAVLTPDARAMVRQTLAVARSVDAAVAGGAHLDVDLLDAATPPGCRIDTPEGTIELVVDVAGDARGRALRTTTERRPDAS